MTPTDLARIRARDELSPQSNQLNVIAIASAIKDRRELLAEVDRLNRLILELREVLICGCKAGG